MAIIAPAGFGAGCATIPSEPQAVVTSSGGPSMQQAQAEAYNGPKARIAIGKFSNKASKGGPQAAQGIADMLTTALFNSNRYIVLERGGGLKDVMEEQDLGASGRIKGETAAQIGEIEGAELLVTGAITSFEPDAAGIGGGIGAPIGTSAIGIGGFSKTAYLAMDLRVIDTKTSRILAAVTVEANSQDFAVLGGAIINWAVPVGLGGYRNTPMEKTLRVAIHKAVQTIVSNTPAQYYHN